MILLFKNKNAAIREDEAVFQRFMKNRHFIHFIGMIDPPKPGVSECAALVEFRHFRPGTQRNDLLSIRLLDWEDIIWKIISIPEEDMEYMESIVGECGLIIMKAVPATIDKGQIITFPVKNERTFLLLNAPGHPVFRNDPDLLKILLKAEALTVEKIQEKI